MYGPTRTLLFLGFAAFGLISIVDARRAESSEQPPLTWALIPGRAVQQSGLADLLTVELQSLDNIQVLERADLGKVISELELSTLSKREGVSERLQLGKLIAADRIIVLTEWVKDRKKHVELTICETRQGARLSHQFVPVNGRDIEDTLTECMREIRSVHYRFRHGIKLLVGVPPFLCEDVLKTWDHLQTGFSQLLESSLQQIPGVATVELIEAHAIQRELALGGATLGNIIVPAIIEGRFEVDRSTTPRRFSIDLSLVRGGKQNRQIRHSRLTLDQTTDLLRHVIANELFKSESIGQSQPLTKEEQFKTLALRAGTTSIAGEHELAARLRDAALLLKPLDVEQRKAAIFECVAALKYVQDLEGTLAAPGTNILVTPSNLDDEQVFHVSAQWFRRASHHLQFLAQNRLVTMLEAAALMTPILSRSDLVNRTRKQTYEREALKLRDDFVWRMLDLCGQYLEQKATLQGHDQLAAVCSHWIFHHKSIALGSGRRADEDLTHILPDLERFLSRSTREPAPLARFVSPFCIGMATSANEGRLELPAVQSLYSRLERSKNEIDRFYGRLGQFMLRVTSEQSNSTTRLHSDLETIEDGLMRQLGHLSRADRDYAEHGFNGRFLDIRKRIDRRGLPPTPAAKTGSERVPRAFSFQRTGMVAEWFDLLKCGPNLDVMWNRSNVRVRTPLGIETILETDKRTDRIHDVAWDGNNFWVVRVASGVSVFTSDGKIIGTIPVRADRKTNQSRPAVTSDDVTYLLPPWSVPPTSGGYLDYSRFQIRKGPPLLHAIEPGRCIIAGFSRLNVNTWIAELTLASDHRVRCRLLHSATRTPPKVRERVVHSDDLRNAHTPSWKAEVTHDDRRVLIIGRSGGGGGSIKLRQPFAVDLTTGEVSLFPTRVSTTQSDYRQRLGIGSTLLSPTPRAIHCLRQLKVGSAWTDQVAIPDEKRAWKLRAQFIQQNEHALVPGPRWFSIDLKTGVTTSLTENEMPNEFRFQHYGVSAFDGLVGWTQGKEIHRISIQRQSDVESGD